MAGLLQLDWTVFRWINSSAQTPFLNWIAPILSEASTWWTVTAAIIVASVVLRKPQGVKLVLLCLLLLGITDGLAGSVLKPVFARPRPCHQEEVHLVTGNCGGRNSFPSNHAANGGAVWVTAGYFLPAVASSLIGLIVLLVGLSRIYLGVHFPSDVLVGFLFGGGVAFIGLHLLNKYFNLGRQAPSRSVSIDS